MTTPEQGAKTAQKLVNSKRVYERFSVIKERWSDEKEFEQISEYQEHLQGFMPKGIKVVGMKKRPFAAIVEIDGFRSRYALTLSSKGMHARLRLDKVTA